MHTVSDIQIAITQLSQLNPDALRLGELVSLAVRIEPELLRTIRLELTPFDAAAEADLWFSSLVETRTADWIALAPVATGELRSTLAQDHSRLEAAHELITKVHCGAPPTIILEEEIIWLALRGTNDASHKIESHLRQVLGKLLEDTEAHRGLAHWFAGAARRLPTEAQATEAYALLYFVTSGLLDGRRINAPDPTLPAIDALAGVFPATIPKLHLWATLSDYGLTLRPNRVPGFVSLEVPRTDPLLLELRPLNEPNQFITLRRGETKTFNINPRAVELRTVTGEAYRLRRRPYKRPVGGMQNLIMGFGGTGAHILTTLKELTLLKHGQVPENIKFLLFDTIADWQPGKHVQIVGGFAEEKLAVSDDSAASLDPFTEYFYLTDFDPVFSRHVFDYLSRSGKPDAFPHMKDWLHAGWFSEHIPPSNMNISHGAAQHRQIARYAIFKNAEKIVAQLQRTIRRLADLAEGRDVNIWLIGSSAGGTGAGCLIDAAYLTRLAARHVPVKLNGIVVLPNVYANLPGVNQGRAYSLLRELDRVQEQGIPLVDRYVDTNRQELVSSKVVYDKQTKQVASVPSRLFDDLLYLGSECIDEEGRQRFFTSVASAIDPYLDPNAGPVLLEKTVNDIAPASAIGAARIYVPTETLTEMFAWEQVAEYLRRVGAPREIEDRVVGLFAGPEMEREATATNKTRGLLELFKFLLDLQTMPSRVWEVYAHNELDSRRIVNVWYELSGSSRTSAEQTILLTYADPCYSLIEAERPADKRVWETQTYRENAAARGVKETQEESRARFADRLEFVTRRYTNPNGGERTFERGRRYLLETVSSELKKGVDHIFISELELRRYEFAKTEEAPEQGTALTQLFAEVQWILSDVGPLHKVNEVVRQLGTIVAAEQGERESRYIRALQELRESKRVGFFNFGTWVEPYQQTARDECSEFIRWYQKYQLLKDMQQLVSMVEQRFREWERLLVQFLDALVLREEPYGSEALLYSTQYQLKRRQARLDRLASNSKATISFGSQPDHQMHGYQEELRRQSAQGLAAELLNQSHWEAGIGADGTPALAMVIDSYDLTQRYSARDIRGLLDGLYQHFYKRIDERLSNTDVFDYLVWLREHEGLEPNLISQLLNTQATPLINAGGVPETGILLYSDPAGDKKKDLAQLFVHKLQSLDGVERSYSDRNSITLLKIKKPRLDQIREVEDCRDEYLRLCNDALNNNEPHDRDLYRAIGFHPFRQELEAWFIERYHLKKTGFRPIAMLPPRIVRLLEDPEMMQIFVRGIATEAIEKTETDWVWHGPTGDTDVTNGPFDDIIKAAINFVLRQGEARHDSFRRINRDDARQSVVESAQKKGRTVDEMIAAFVESQLDRLLTENAPADLHNPLKMVFTFYCDPNTRTDLQYRMDL